MSERIQTGDLEPIYVEARDKTGDPLTGATDLFVRLFRDSDGEFFDWADLTFKAAGHTTLNKLLTEVDATNAPGLYRVTGGFNTATITNASADDQYLVVPLQTPGTDAVIPQPGELKVGQWVDGVGLDIVVSATIDAAVPGTLKLIAWLRRRGRPVSSGLVSATVSVHDNAGAVVVASAAMLGPSSDGVFRRDVPTVTLTAATQYYAKCTITDAVGVEVSVTAQPTIG